MKKNESYQKEILLKILGKYHKRIIKDGQISGRRIIVRAKEIYLDYDKANCDLQVKMRVNDAAEELEQCGFVVIEKLKYSDDIERIFLNADKIVEIERHLTLHYGVPARHHIIEKAKLLTEEFRQKGKIASIYCDKLNRVFENTISDIDLDKEKEILKMLAFVENNQRDLYVREASMFVYGSSKHFEKYRYDAVCNIIRETDEYGISADESNDEIMRRFHISNVEQEICIKGDYVICWDDHTLETKYFTGGISLSSKDILRIESVKVNAAGVMTIENKTAFYRFDSNEYASVYLGGFANRHQVFFLKKLFEYNPEPVYYHFGDIDVGGLFIHQHLCKVTGIGFQMFCMGPAELKNPKYKGCLMELLESDLQRIQGLKMEESYAEVVEAMLEMGVKLEQEIVCCDLMGI